MKKLGFLPSECARVREQSYRPFAESLAVFEVNPWVLIRAIVEEKMVVGVIENWLVFDPFLNFRLGVTKTR